MRLPCASSSAAVISATDDLPFVPTTWIEAKRCWGIPSTETSRRIRSSPKPPAERLQRGQVRLAPFEGPGQVSRRAPRARPGRRRASRAPPRRPRPARWSRTPGCRACARRARPRRAAPRAAPRSGGGPASASTSSEARISTGPKLASASPSAPSNDSRASRATSSWGASPSPATRAGSTLPAATPTRSRQRRTLRVSSIAGLDLSLGVVVDRAGVRRPGNGWTTSISGRRPPRRRR